MARAVTRDAGKVCLMSGKIVQLGRLNILAEPVVDDPEVRSARLMMLTAMGLFGVGLAGAPDGNK
jgi:hypothetical protein